MGKASVTKMVNYNNSVDFCSFQVTWFMEVTVELTSNTLFFSRELKKRLPGSSENWRRGDCPRFSEQVI